MQLLDTDYYDLTAREQHIRREKATSNICTAQALLANMAAMYAVYHGPTGLKAIASKVHFFTRVLASQLSSLGGYTIVNGESFFDTLTIKVDGGAEAVHEAARAARINLRKVDGEHVGVTLDESVSPDDLVELINVFASAVSKQNVTLPFILSSYSSSSPNSSLTSSYAFDNSFTRTTPYLQHPVFNTHHSETEMLRYIHHLQSKDLSLVHGMIPLGSCTMKLNSTASMIPLTYEGFSKVHPFAPVEQAGGYEVVLKVRPHSSVHVSSILSQDLPYVEMLTDVLGLIGTGERPLHHHRLPFLLVAA